METYIDNNSGLGYAKRFAVENAAKWRETRPGSLVTIYPRGKRFIIVIDTPSR